MKKIQQIFQNIGKRSEFEKAPLSVEITYTKMFDGKINMNFHMERSENLDPGTTSIIAVIPEQFAPLGTCDDAHPEYGFPDCMDSGILYFWILWILRFLDF